MSWDVMIMRLPPEIRTMEDLESASGDPSLSLGSRSDVSRQISRVFEGTDWSDPACGTWRGDDGGIEFNVGKEDDVKSVMLHVRAGEEVVARITTLVEAPGWRAIDTTTDDFLTTPSNSAGVSGWRSFRDRVLRRAEH